MCYAIPGRITSVSNKTATIDYFGEKKEALVDEEKISAGDYVYAQGGVIIDVVPKEIAENTLTNWKDKFVSLKELDKKISASADKSEDGRVQKILGKNPQDLSKEELLELFSLEDPKQLEKLFRKANSLRREKLDNSCCVHGIIEFSNYCRNNCAYCGIRCGNSGIRRYRMSAEEIISHASDSVKKLGFKALVLQSGEDLSYSQEELVKIVKGIKAKCKTLITLSIGGRKFDTYKKLYAAGARGALIRFETSNSEIYTDIHEGPKSVLKDRIDLINSLQKHGFLVTTGAIIGLPNQTNEDILEDIYLTRSLNAEMYSFGPFISHPQTPLKNFPSPKLNRVLKTIALARLISPESKIVATTALETLDRNGARDGLLAGANSVMINLTPKKYKQLYEIYPNRKGSRETVSDEISEIISLLESLGRAPTDIGITQLPSP